MVLNAKKVKKLLFIGAITTLVLGLTMDIKGLFVISGLLFFFLILEILHDKEEKALSAWYKEVKETKAEDEDWDDVDSAFYSNDIKNN